jgi:hypothetical protein
MESVFTGESGKSFVYVRGAGGFERREVELGLKNHVRAVVKSGVREGEVLAAEPPPASRQPKGTARRRIVVRQGAMDV